VNLWCGEPAAAHEPAAQQPLDLPQPPPELQPLGAAAQEPGAATAAADAAPTGGSADAGGEGGTGYTLPLELGSPRPFDEDASFWRAQRLPPLVEEALMHATALEQAGGAAPGDGGRLIVPRMVQVRYDEPSQAVEAPCSSESWRAWEAPREWCDPPEDE